MYETREVTITLRLPPDIAEQAEEVQKDDPEFLSRVVLYGLTRLQIYRTIREREQKQEPIITVDETKTYKCDMCGGTFDGGWSEEEAEAEYSGSFNELSKEEKEDRAEVCDDCYKIFMAEHGVEPLG